MLKPRNLKEDIQKLVLERYKMLFLSGPRQAGKTTFAKQLLENSSQYFNWDNPKFKKEWVSSLDSFAEKVLNEKTPIILLDEFHKNPKWKNQLKAFYDIYGDKIQIMVTGSAKLDTYRKGSDSLMGRFIHFHMHTFSYGELTESKMLSFKDLQEGILNPEKFNIIVKKNSEEIIKNLFHFSGFPEPYLAASESIHQIWSKNRLELLIRQDIAETSNLLRNHQVDILALLMPDKVGSPLSVQSLTEDLQVSHTTVTRWLNALKQVYYHFDVIPYSKNIARSLKKESKIYLYDWSQVEDVGARFENLVACHLKKAVDYYNDTGQANLSLRYLRDKDKNEVDFIILKNEKPLASFEVKLSELNLDKSFIKFQKKEKFPHFQVVMTSDIFRSYKELNATVISFNKLFQKLP